MKFKIWLKALGKALNPEREEKYLTTLRMRLADKGYKYGSKLIKLTSDLPKYAYGRLQWRLNPHISYRTYDITEIYEVKKKIKRYRAFMEEYNNNEMLKNKKKFQGLK